MLIKIICKGMIKIKKVIKRIVLIILILLWMNLVFGFSSQNGEISGGLSLKIIKIFVQDENLIEILHPIVRKLAHFSLYAVGGILIYTFVSTFNIRKRNAIFITIGVGLLYAISDECHQMLIPGRSGQATDVMIDTLGVIFGNLFSIWFGKLSPKAKGNIVVLILLVLILGWMAAVFTFSSQDGSTSTSLSLKITKMITQDKNKIKIIHPIVRKMAHFSIYTVGGMLIYLLLNNCNMKKIFKIGLTLFLGVLYAATDEYHQYFVSKRTAKLTDVWIDSLGVILGIILAIIICKIISMIFKKKEVNKDND